MIPSIIVLIFAFAGLFLSLYWKSKANGERTLYLLKDIGWVFIIDLDVTSCLSNCEGCVVVNVVTKRKYWVSDEYLQYAETKSLKEIRNESIKRSPR